MSFIDCIRANTEIPESKREELVREYSALSLENSQRFGDIDGPQIAARRYIEMKAKVLAQQSRNRVRHALADKASVEDLHIGATAYSDLKKGWGSLFRFSNNYVGYFVGKLEKTAVMAGAEREEAFKAISKILEDYRSKNAGFTQDVAGFKKIVSEILGSKTGDQHAMPLAKEVKDLLIKLRDKYESVGGIIGKIDNYFPQRDLPDVVRRNFTKQEWKDAKYRLVDRSKMMDPRTGVPLSDGEFDAALEEIWLEMMNLGLDDIGAATARTAHLSKGDIASRRSSHRFFIYKDAQSFFENNHLFGGGDATLFDNLVDYINSITRDTVVMREFGPKSGVVVDHAIATAKTNGAPFYQQKLIKGMFDTVSGANSYGGAAGVGTKMIQGTQNGLRAAWLGAAPVSASSDAFWGAMTAKYNGLKSSDVMRHYFSYLNPFDANDRKIAKRMVMVASAVNGNGLAQARHADITRGGGYMRWAADTVNRASGLGIMTDAIRTSIAQSAQGAMAHAKDIGMKFNELPKEMLDAFKRWDISETDYDNIVKAEPWVHGSSGADFIGPDDVAKIDIDSARKYSYWLHDMSQTASNEPRLLTQAITTGAAVGEAKQGTPLRNVATSAFMFKSFGITVLLNHIIPSLQRGANDGKWGRAAAIATISPILGAMTLQAKQYIYGKTAMDMDNLQFWKMSAMQSGAFGYFGDFILADTNRYDYNLGEALAGPVPQLATDMAKLFYGNMEKAIEDGEETKFLAQSAKNFQKYTPKLWYLRIFQERLMYDQINRMADPMYDVRMQRLENKMMQETGQSYWSKPNN